MNPSNLQFTQNEDGSISFDTGALQGVLRGGGKSNGLVPVIYTADGAGSGTALTGGEGLFNHYRVFTLCKRYGYGARRWPSTAELHADGSVEVFWEATDERPFELSGTYSWVAPNTIDLVTTVRAQEKLAAFEVFLASYYQPPFIDSRVWARRRFIRLGHTPACREQGFQLMRNTCRAASLPTRRAGRTLVVCAQLYGGGVVLYTFWYVVGYLEWRNVCRRNPGCVIKFTYSGKRDLK